MKYIDTDKLINEIKRLKQLNTVRDDEDYAQYELDVACGYDMACEEIVSAINSLQREPRFPQYNNIVDKIFGAGNLEEWERDEAEMLVALAKEELLKSLQQNQQIVVDSICFKAGILAPYKDGNQWCILKGDNIQVGVVGFGDTKEDALVDFIKNVKTPQEQPEVDK